MVALYKLSCTFCPSENWDEVHIHHPIHNTYQSILRIKFYESKVIYDQCLMLFTIPQIYPDCCSLSVASRLTMAVACGPYAPSNSLDYSPLADLIKYVNRDKPDLLVLMGPFVDTKNTLISVSGNCIFFVQLVYTCLMTWRNDKTHQLQTLGACTENLYVSLSAEFSFIRIGNNSTSANSENPN